LEQPYRGTQTPNLDHRIVVVAERRLAQLERPQLGHRVTLHASRSDEPSLGGGEPGARRSDARGLCGRSTEALRRPRALAAAALRQRIERAVRARALGELPARLRPEVLDPDIWLRRGGERERVGTGDLAPLDQIARVLTLRLRAA